MRKLVLLLFVLAYLSISVNAQNTSFWGITPYGVNGAGCIYRTNSTGGNLSIQYALQEMNPGASAQDFRMIQASNGLLYGLTEKGGANNEGVLFSYNPVSNVYTSIVFFKSYETGCNPYGYLLAASNGKFYGVCQRGGVSNSGTIFEFDIATNSVNKVVDFANKNMKHPNGSLIQATNGKLYGVTKYCNNSNGGLYEYDIINDSLIVKFVFSNNQVFLEYPGGALLQCSNGLLYGSTRSQLFTFDLSNNNMVKIHNFMFCYHRFGSLIEGSDGNIYGVKIASNQGCIFVLDTATDSLVNKINIPASEGYQPSGGLVELKNGKLYGAFKEGFSKKGFVYEYDMDSSSVSVYSVFTGPTTGDDPVGTLIKSGNKYYGYCSKSTLGAPYGGALFEIDTSTQIISKKVVLNYAPNGSNILSGFQHDNNGGLWGICKEGAQEDKGGYFFYDISSHNYSMEFPIVYPKKENVVSPILASDGKLYSLNTIGMYYQYNPNLDTYNYLGFINAEIAGPMIEGAPGDLYFMTNWNVPNMETQIIRLKLSNLTFTTIHSFLSGWVVNPGRYASGVLLYSSSGFLYGMTMYGGESGAGVLFKLNLQNHVYSKEVVFGDTLGEKPNCGLAEDNNGVLYGTTVYGGAYGEGVFFKYNPMNKTYVKIFDFDSLMGMNPQGKLLLASNGNIYGITINGGANNLGTIFEYNPLTNTMSKQSDFTDSTGRPSSFSYLVEVDNSVSIQNSKSQFEFEIFPNPTHGALTVSLRHPVKIINVLVQDIYGKTVYVEKVGRTQQFSLNLQLARGIYFLQLVSSDGVCGVKKFIIE